MTISAVGCRGDNGRLPTIGVGMESAMLHSMSGGLAVTNKHPLKLLSIYPYDGLSTKAGL
jgi:hypothetical protein